MFFRENKSIFECIHCTFCFLGVMTGFSLDSSFDDFVSSGGLLDAAWKHRGTTKYISYHSYNMMYFSVNNFIVYASSHIPAHVTDGAF